MPLAAIGAGGPLRIAAKEGRAECEPALPVARSTISSPERSEASEGEVSCQVFVDELDALLDGVGVLALDGEELLSVALGLLGRSLLGRRQPGVDPLGHEPLRLLQH